MSDYRYKAFISYSHKDERWASWLHRRLENYRFPAITIGRVTDKGAVPKSLKPIFRDKDELTAGADLGAKIQESLNASENLIVLCTPRSAQSYWVQQEILHFKRHNNAANIYALIVDGEPFAKPDSGAQECFPEALKYELTHDGEMSDILVEPLAADARDQGDGKNLATLKLLSGMAGLGLDDLVQRDLRRARRRVTGITLASLMAMVVMGSLTWLAVDARKEAEARRTDAEGLIEFMLTDLRDKLEPVGRLEVLDAVGQKASDYYDSYDLESQGADAIGQHATANHLLGDIQLRMGNIAEAEKYFEPAFEVTKRQLDADPNNPDRIYDHIQSVFWIAQPYQRRRDNEAYLDYQETYLELAERLYDIEGDTDRAVIEKAYGLSNVGNSWFRLEDYEKAEEYAKASLPLYQEIAGRKKTPKSFVELSNRYRDLANAVFILDDIKAAYNLELKSSDILKQVARDHPRDFLVLKNQIQSDNRIADYLIKFEKFHEAEKLLSQNLTAIEQASKIEPNDDSLKKAKLKAHQWLIAIGRAQNQSKLIAIHTENMGRLLEDRLSQRQSYDFDQEWDFERPFAHIRGLMVSNFMAGEFDAAKLLLPKYENLLSRIEGRPGFEEAHRSTTIFYLISRAFLNDDSEAFQQIEVVSNLAGPDEDLSKNDLIIGLLSHKYCGVGLECDANAYKISQADLTSPVFGFFENRYPELAQKIRNEIESTK